MKKGLAVFSILVFSFAIFAPSQEAEARHRYNWRERVCNFIEHREIRSWKYFDQDRDRTVNRTQRLVNWQERWNCSPDDTIVGQLLERSQFNTLAAALTEADLVDTLNGEGNFTVFAPTDQAFEKLGQETIDAVLANLPLLTDILTYHVVDPVAVPTAVPSDVAVTLTEAPMFNGENVSVELRGGDLFFNDSQVIVTDLKATNGIVHVIDTVLLPTSAQ